jgi:hypothetical protein
MTERRRGALSWRASGAGDAPAVAASARETPIKAILEALLASSNLNQEPRDEKKPANMDIDPCASKAARLAYM